MKNLNFATLLLILVILFGCKDPPEIIKEPAPTEPFTAHFSIYEEVRDSMYVTDSLVVWNFATIKADDFYFSYNWKIGNDPREFTGNKVRLYFDDDALHELVKVTLIATGPPNTEIFPNDNGIDTLEKVFRVIPRYKTPLIGKYMGIFSNSNDVLDTVEIKHFSPIDFPEIDDDRIILMNVNKGCYNKIDEIDEVYFGSIGYGVNGMYFDSPGNLIGDCKSPTSNIKRIDYDSITINSTITEDGYNYEMITFKGKRINKQ